MKGKKNILAVAITIWAVAVGVGTVWMTDYASRPGPAAISPSDLPVHSPNSGADRPSLVVFLHPYCPCSRATLAELVRLVENEKGRVDVQIYFYKPSEEKDAWMKTDLWKQALAIPNVSVGISSEDEIEKFGAITSGQALLYSTTGKLVFSGGITAGRGHEGANVGRDSIETYLRTGRTEITQTPVFGCILTSADPATGLFDNMLQR